MLAEVPFTTPFLENLLRDETELQYMLAFEMALALAQANVGDIPESAAAVISEVCQQPNWQDDIAYIRQQTLLAGNPAIPFVNQLKARVAEADPEAARYAHRGATSQDVLDTTLMMQLGEALRQFQNDLMQLIDQLTLLNQLYGSAPMMGRTLLQHALPITFGDKLMGWLDGIIRAADRLKRIAQSGLVVQLGGPVGTLTQLGAHGPAIRTQVAETLGLTDVPAWHTQRDYITDIAAALGMLNGSLGKLANDMILLMQTEVEEVREGAAEGKGGSSSMPHKRNPVSATFMLAIAHQTPGLVSSLLGVMIQPHERGAGAWHSEWPVIRQLARLTAANLHHANDLLAHLEIDTERMYQNLNRNA